MTSVTQMIILNQDMLLRGSNHFLKSIFINLFDNNFLCFTFSPTRQHRFLLNLTFHFHQTILNLLLDGNKLLQ